MTLGPKELLVADNLTWIVGRCFIAIKYCDLIMGFSHLYYWT